MLIGCLLAMLSFGTCNRNRGGFTVCAVKNNLGILVCLVVVFIPKRTRFELPYLYVVEATLENKCTVSVCVFKTTIMQVMSPVLSLFILFPIVFPQAAQAHYVWVRASEVIWSQHTRIISVLSDAI